jgi:hypothetical protein
VSASTPNDPPLIGAGIVGEDRTITARFSFQLAVPPGPYDPATVTLNYNFNKGANLAPVTMTRQALGVFAATVRLTTAGNLFGRIEGGATGSVGQTESVFKIAVSTPPA